MAWKREDKKSVICYTRCIETQLQLQENMGYFTKTNTENLELLPCIGSEPLRCYKGNLLERLCNGRCQKYLSL